NVHLEAPHWWMVNEEAAQSLVERILHHAPPPARLVDPHRAAAARPMQPEPVAPILDPVPDHAILLVRRERPSHVRDQQPAALHTAARVVVVVRAPTRHPRLLHNLKNAQTGIVVVVPGITARRDPAGDDMSAWRLCRHHGPPSSARRLQNSGIEELKVGLAI